MVTVDGVPRAVLPSEAPVQVAAARLVTGLMEGTTVSVSITERLEDGRIMRYEIVREGDEP